MSRFKIYQENCSDVTVVSNLFIDEYMKDANDAQLKIYLYLLRVMGAGHSTSVSDIADQFNHTEKDVVRALKYWEKNHLLTLEYDDTKNLSGIRLLDVSKRSSDDVVSLAPVVQLPPKQEALDAKPAFSKPSYSLDQLKEFQNKEETAQLLFVAEQYIGRPLSPSEIKTILFFADRLHFSEDLIDYLIQYCVDKGKKDFRYIEKVAISWAGEGITTPKQAAKFAVKYEKSVYDVMKALGKSGIPTKAEADYVMKWSKTYGFTKDIILEACNRTIEATHTPSFAYANKILSVWKKAGVKNLSDVEDLDMIRQKQEKEKGEEKKKKSKAVNHFHNFEQSSTSYDSLMMEKVRARMEK